MTEAALHADKSLDARLEAFRAAASILEWPLPRERDERVCSEFVHVVERLFALLARGPGALDVTIGEGLAALASGEGALVLGHSGIGDYAREDLGIAASTAQKMMRRARELQSRPLLRAAVREGTVSVRQADAVLPVARGEDEALWVERARKQSVRALKKAVIDPDGAKPDDPDEEEEGVTFRANLAAELRPIVDEAEELAGKAVGATSPRWERTRAVCQEYLGAHPAPDDGDEAGPFLSSPADDLEPLKELLEKESEQWASLGRPAPVPAPELVSGAADVRALDAELRRFARQRERWGDVFGFVAMVFIRVRGWEYVGFASFKHYCEERLGMSVRAVEQRAALERRLYELSPLREAMRERRVSYEQARLIARHADAGSVRELIERAEQLTCIELRRELQGKEEAQMCARRQYRVWLPLSVAGLLALTIQAVRKAEGRWLPAGECYARACAHFIEVWKPVLSGPSTVPKRVLRRDRGYCKVPVCSRAAAHAHHIAYRSAGGSDDMTNLTSLCAPHHLRGVHMGRVRIRPVPPDRLRWELGVGEGGAARRVFVRPAPGRD